MKLFSILFGIIFANPMMNLLLIDQASDGDDSSNDNLLMMMVMSPGLLGDNQVQADQMNPLLPLMLMDESGNNNTMMLMRMMMQNPNAGIDQMLPFLLLDDGQTDMKSLFLMTTIMQNNCQDTNNQMNMLLPLLLMSEDDKAGGDANGRRRDTDDDGNDSTLKTLLLLQIMSEGNRGLDMNTVLPFLVMDAASDNDDRLLMVMINSMTGGLDSSDGFANNFNMLLPLLLGSEGGDDGDSDMLFILMAMQSQAPGSSMGSKTILPLLLMDTESDNTELIMFMAMMNNQSC